VVLRLNGTLDYETEKRYRLVVRAYDGAGLHGDLIVNIAVTDVNDMVPVFDQSLYQPQVLENATIGMSPPSGYILRLGPQAMLGEID